MSQAIPVRSLRNEYGRILREVATGESFTITNDGVPVATIGPYVPTTPTGPREGVPVSELRELLRVAPRMTPQERADLDADLAEADWGFTSGFVVGDDVDPGPPSARENGAR